MDLEWFKNYYNLKCEVIKNHEGQEIYAIIIKSVQSIPREIMYHLGDRGFNYKFCIKPPTNLNLLPPHSYLRMLYLFNTSPKLSNIPMHQINNDHYLPFISQLRISRCDI